MENRSFLFFPTGKCHRKRHLFFFFKISKQTGTKSPALQKPTLSKGKIHRQTADFLSAAPLLPESRYGSASPADKVPYSKMKFPSFAWYHSFYAQGAKLHATARTMAGRKFATFTFLPNTRFRPTQKIIIDPTRDRLDRAASVISGSMSLARKVITP